MEVMSDQNHGRVDFMQGGRSCVYTIKETILNTLPCGVPQRQLTRKTLYHPLPIPSVCHVGKKIHLSILTHLP